MTIREKMALRRLARQYAAECLQECEHCDRPPESVTPECVLTRMEEDGLPVREFDWLALVELIARLLELLRPLFLRDRVGASEQKAEKVDKADKAEKAK